MNGRILRLCLGIVAVAGPGCICSPGSEVDAGAAHPDAGEVDAGMATDAGTQSDAGTLDSGALDSGVEQTDGGMTVDGDDPDGGVSMADAGDGWDGGTDSGVPDAGPDLTPPTLVIFKQTPPRPIIPRLRWDSYRPDESSDWKIDEDPVIAVGSAEADVDLASLSLTVELDGGTLSLDAGVTRSVGCVCPFPCACFQIDGARLPRIGLDSANTYRGGSVLQTVTVRAHGSDFAGNAATRTGEFRVSRILWTWGFAPDGGADEGRLRVGSVAPTLDPDGNLYVFSDDGLASLTPYGALRWRVPGVRPFSFWPALPVLYLPVDAGMILWSEVPTDGGSLALVARSAGDGSLLHTCPLSFPWWALSAPVALRSSSRWAAVVAGTDGGEDFLLNMPFGDGATTFACNFVPLPFRFAAGTQTAFTKYASRVKPVAFADVLCFASDDKRLHCGAMTDAGTLSSPATFSSITLAATADTDVILRSLVAVEKDAGFRVIGNVQRAYTGQLSTTAGIFVANPNTNLEEGTAPQVPLRLYASLLTVGTSASGGLRTYMGLSVTNPSWFNSVGMVDLDRGQLELTGIQPSGAVDENNDVFIAADRRLYYETSGLFVFREDAGSPNPELAIEWSSAYAGAVIDCNRRGQGGVLYSVMDRQMLQAVLVESPGLDTLAPWPRKNRDPANSSNGGIDLLRQYRCPGTP